MLGKIKKVDLRKVWMHEALNLKVFTCTKNKKIKKRRNE
jgi:hypothetical protein